MSESKLEKKILYTLVCVLLGILLALILRMNITLSEIKISSSLATFLGALAGAGISGGTAIYVMHRDISFRKDEKQKEAKDNFDKSLELIRMWTRSYLLTVGNINNFMNLNGGKAKQSLLQELEAIKKCKASLDNINDDYIPRDIYKHFLELKSYIELKYHQYSAYVSTIELTYGDDEVIVVKENESLKEFLIDNYKQDKESIRSRFFEISNYKI
ncbi:hypothetical protein [Psychrobacillus lasiicapitis]|uniref:Uncharacterized protein n=1 Tax=Psychrobacillus lasiicapitis TaxID=1636719 RepID=A0A544TAF7_9BACI|nr:hypothetical protein [Psychrobacillus lasiicapitis]TQR14451.1 hypothetical protein FG382_08325 [Psychrobacillus lasiicapitis]GGA31236.1 hypothetical protein GCM10011384_20900 [Psychrobacillus lasiicapitis]